MTAKKTIVAALAILISSFTAVPARAEWAAVMGTGKKDLTFRARRTSDPGWDSIVLTTTFTYGLGEQTDVWAALPFLVDSHPGDDQGLQDISLGMKWNFARSGDWKFSLSPYVTLPTGDTGLTSDTTNVGCNSIASWWKDNRGISLNLDLFTLRWAGTPDDTGYLASLQGEWDFEGKCNWGLLGAVYCQDRGGGTESYAQVGLGWLVAAPLWTELVYRAGLNDVAADSAVTLKVSLTI